MAVAVTGAPGSDVLLVRAADIAARSHVPLLGIHVRQPVDERADTSAQLGMNRRLLEHLGGTYREVAGVDVARALVRFARAEGATQLVLGGTGRSRLQRLRSGSVLTDVMRHAGTSLDLHIVARGVTTDGDDGRVRPPHPLPPSRRRAGWGIVVFGLALLTIVLTALGSSVDLSSALLLYLLVVVLAAAVGGPRPAAAAAIAAFAVVNWFFVPPVHHWKIGRVGDVVALSTFAVVAAVVGSLVIRAEKRQVEAADARMNARTLAAMSGASVGDDPLSVLVDQLREAFQLDAVAVTSARDGRVEAGAGSDQVGPPDLTLRLGDHHQLAIRGGPLSSDEREILAVFADHLTAALTTRQLRHEAGDAAALAEANAFRTAILAAVSHDLRTPLASIKASVTSLRQRDVAWPTDAVAEFLATIDEETDRLNGLIGNLLDLSRLQTDTLCILERDIGLEEVAPAALASLGELARRVDTDVSEALPRVRVDPGLLERSLANLVANAVAWSPTGARVRIDAAHVDGKINLRVIDTGPGIPVQARAAVFEPFQRLGDRGTNGVGLGLAVARGFITAMAGEVVVQDTPGGGTTMVVSLPVAP